jgi:hypothetical protein
MDFLIKLLFVATLIYLVSLMIRIAIAGYSYDKEKKKNDKDYNESHSVGKFGEPMSGHFVIPRLIHDNDPSRIKHVMRYNKLAKTYWISILIGIPLLIYLGKELNKLS